MHLYARIPFGQQHSKNAQVIALAAALDRTPNSVAMKLNNLTSLDPEERARGVSGLPGASTLDRRVWDEFAANPVATAEESETLWEARMEPRSAPLAESVPPVRIEDVALRRIRLGQAYFRRVVLANFDGRCALTGIAHAALLNASHIVGWAEHDAHRVDPRNGIALNRLHDAAFDRKLITFDEDLRLVVGRQIRDTLGREELATGFLPTRGARSEAA